MGKFAVDPDRPQSQAEEMANSISHGMAMLAAITGATVLIVDAARHHSLAYLIGAIIFSSTAIFLYLASALYHAMPQGRSKRILRVIEHSAIFLLIAGTYTPFTLGALRGTWGWALFGIIWALAAAGVAMKIFGKTSRPFLSTGLYVAMGWLIVIGFDPLVEHVPAAGLLWLFAGGVSYTVGVLFYILDSRMLFGHLVWHFFVIGGTVCHFFSILWYAA